MGATSVYFTFKATAGDVDFHVQDRIDQDAIDNGSHRYSGGIGQKEGFRILNETFSSSEEFYEFAEDNYGSKWDDYVTVAEIIEPVDSSDIVKPKGLIALESQYASLKADFDAFDSKVLASIKGHSSKTISCKSCGHRHDISEMSSIKCKKCRCNILTNTQKKQKESLQKKLAAVREKMKKAQANFVKKSTGLSDAKEKEEQKLLEQLDAAKKEYKEFDSKVLIQVRKQKSKTKSCKNCKTRYNVSDLSLYYRHSFEEGTFDCPCCGRSFLSPTQRSQKHAIYRRMETIKEKLRNMPERTYALFSSCAE